MIVRHVVEVALFVAVLPYTRPLVVSHDPFGGLSIVTVRRGALIGEVVAAGVAALTTDERNLIRAQLGLPPVPADVIGLLGGPDRIVTAATLPEIIPPCLAGLSGH